MHKGMAGVLLFVVVASSQQGRAGLCAVSGQQDCTNDKLGLVMTASSLVQLQKRTSITMQQTDYAALACITHGQLHVLALNVVEGGHAVMVCLSRVSSTTALRLHIRSCCECCPGLLTIAWHTCQGHHLLLRWSEVCQLWSR